MSEDDKKHSKKEKKKDEKKEKKTKKSKGGFQIKYKIAACPPKGDGVVARERIPKGCCSSVKSVSRSFFFVLF